MAYLYDVTVATRDGDANTVVKTIKEARAFVKENSAGGSYWIDRVDVGRPTIELLIDVINSHGGNYAFYRETVEMR